jgi:hypothetical protein
VRRGGENAPLAARARPPAGPELLARAREPARGEENVPDSCRAGRGGALSAGVGVAPTPPDPVQPKQSDLRVLMIYVMVSKDDEPILLHFEEMQSGVFQGWFIDNVHEAAHL